MTSETTLQATTDELKKQLRSTSPELAKQAEKTAIELAEQGNLKAAEMLVSVYSDGTAVIPRDRIQEFRYTKKAADLGSSFCRCWLAHLQRESGDFAGALENVRIGHAAGEIFGTNLLAKMMLAGEGEPARPLDALQLLSESVAKGYNTDAAALLAEIYLEGKYFPQNPQKAYDTLHGMASMFETMTRVADTERYGRYLYLKSQAIAQGAVPANGESAEGLLAQAAKFGNPDAVQRKQDDEQSEAMSARRREWEAMAHFEAARGKWKMFFHRGYLETSELQAGRRRLSFRNADEDQRFQVTVPSNVKLAKDQPYAVIYVGPAEQNDGMPVLIFDPATGKTYKTTVNVWNTYSEHVSNLPLLLGIALGGMALYLFFSGSVLLMLCSVAFAMGAYKLFSNHTKAYKKALHDAAAFFRRHPDILG